MTASPATPQQSSTLLFSDLGLPAPLLEALKSVGYESPSPIQAQTIPPLLEGRDVLGQAQTGTGKTAAFALPLLARLDLSKRLPQALVLAPTRELAIQVAEAFQRYAANLPGFHVLPIYGGQSYTPQLTALKRGVHVIVGTPGRVIDHMERGTLKLDGLRCLVLDEADEMLRMGFVDDIEKILKRTPPTRQVVLFSATMPPPIRRIAQTHLKSPVEITIRGKTSTVANTRQRYWLVSGFSKLDALTRILEAEPFDGMLVFARTKQNTVELAEKLEARGFAVAPLNGDIEQKVRERTIARLKSGDIDIIVATDIAARGLDVERISHVINFDIPHDTESYIHRIGRTGRAGRSGEAILFIAPRERHMLKIIERATRQNIAQMQLPTPETIADQRVAKFKNSITQTLSSPELAERLAELQSVVEQIEREQQVSAREVAAALAHLAQGNAPPAAAATRPKRAGPVTPYQTGLPAHTPRSEPPTPRGEKPGAKTPLPSREKTAFESPPLVRERIVPASPPPKAQVREDFPAQEDAPRSEAPLDRAREKVRRPKAPEHGMETYRIEVGSKHGVEPGNIVGAIANEADLDSQYIGRIRIFDDHSLVDLPEGMPKETFQDLQKVWVSGQQMKISRFGSAPPTDKPKGPPPPRSHRETFPKHRR
jgi:ATP-dependent RNA helicase DeaD